MSHFALAWLVFLAAAPGAAAQPVGSADLDRLVTWTEARCIEPMRSGRMPETEDLRAVTDVWDTVFTDAAVTLDDRVVVDVRDFRGLRSCAVGTNSAQTQLESGAGVDAAIAVATDLAERLSLDGFSGPEQCQIDGIELAAGTVLEPGDFLVRMYAPIEVADRPNLTLMVEIGVSRAAGEISTDVLEVFGVAEPRC